MAKKLNKNFTTPITEVPMSLTVEALMKVVEKEAEIYPKMLAPPNLIEVCRAGSTWGARTAIARSEDVNQRDDREAAKLLLPGYTALHWAAAMGHFGCIQAMLSSDEIDLNPTDTEEEDGYTPLQLCINYKQRDWDKCQKLMRAHGAKVRIPTESELDSDEEYDDDDMDPSTAENGSSLAIAVGNKPKAKKSSSRTNAPTASIIGGLASMFGGSRLVSGGSSVRKGGASKRMSKRVGGGSRMTR
mmetsp:Transcript_79076/g.115859  ORF Transcript_79076/g.115859 Transcript_79076/m.115859 type:complete len:244 (+) Transcript_79076:224-955(+)